MKKILIILVSTITLLSNVANAQIYNRHFNNGSITIGGAKITNNGRGVVGGRITIPLESNHSHNNVYINHGNVSSSTCYGYGSNRRCTSGGRDDWRNPDYNHGYVDGYYDGSYDNRYPVRRPELRVRRYDNQWNNAKGCVGLYANQLECENSRRALEEKYDRFEN